MTSMSLTVSVRRRTDPASETSLLAGCSRSTSTTAWTAGSALARSVRFSRGFAVSSQRLEDPLLGLGAKAGERPELLGLGCLAQIVHGRDPEVLPDPPGGLRPQSREPQELRDAGRDPLLAFGQRLDLAGLHDLDDLRLDRLSDPREVLRLAGEGLLGDRAGRRADLIGCTTVRQHPELLLPLELEEIGQEVELLGHLLRAVGSVVATHDHMDVLVVCLPTYNERENLEAMVSALGEVLPDDGRILVIDDSSPDGTGEIADRLASERDNVDVLHRERKEGLGPAYLAGFRRALEMGADLVMEMDCDFSHNPADVPRLVAAAEDADVVLGSRYASGGGTKNWGVVRRLISRGGSLYAQILLGLRIRDLTGGFKVYRRAVLETIDLSAIHSKGYAFQIETTYRALKAGFRVVEVPIVFVDREVGGSKMSRSIVLEAIWKVPALRLSRL